MFHDYDDPNDLPFEDFDERDDLGTYLQAEYDDRPYGFGLEPFEDKSRNACCRALRPLEVRVGGACLLSDAFVSRLIREQTTISPRAERCAQRVWDKLWRDVQTPHDVDVARRRYKEWASKTHKFRAK